MSNSTEASKVSPKVKAAGGSAALAVVVVWALSAFGVDVPEEVAVAIPTVLAVAAGYLQPDRLRELGDALANQPHGDDTLA